MARCAAEKNWHQFLNAAAKCGTNSQTVAQEQEWTVIGGCYFLWALWVVAVISHSFWTGAWMVALTSRRLWGTMETCIPRAPTMTPTKRASDLQIPRHNLAHFCWATLCHSKCRLFLISPAAPLRGVQVWAGLTGQGCSTIDGQGLPLIPLGPHTKPLRLYGPPSLRPPVPQEMPPSRDAVEGKGLRRRSLERLDGRLEEVAKAVAGSGGGGTPRFLMPTTPPPTNCWPKAPGGGGRGGGGALGGASWTSDHMP